MSCNKWPGGRRREGEGRELLAATRGCEGWGDGDKGGRYVATYRTRACRAATGELGSTAGRGGAPVGRGIASKGPAVGQAGHTGCGILGRRARGNAPRHRGGRAYSSYSSSSLLSIDGSAPRSSAFLIAASRAPAPTRKPIRGDHAAWAGRASPDSHLLVPCVPPRRRRASHSVTSPLSPTPPPVHPPTPLPTRGGGRLLCRSLRALQGSKHRRCCGLVLRSQHSVSKQLAHLYVHQ